jgi:hypothetical protein
MACVGQPRAAINGQSRTPAPRIIGPIMNANGRPGRLPKSRGMALGVRADQQMTRRLPRRVLHRGEERQRRPSKSAVTRGPSNLQSAVQQRAQTLAHYALPACSRAPKRCRLSACHMRRSAVHAFPGPRGWSRIFLLPHSPTPRPEKKSRTAGIWQRSSQVPDCAAHQRATRQPLQWRERSTPGPWKPKSSRREYCDPAAIRRRCRYRQDNASQISPVFRGRLGGTFQIRQASDQFRE